MSKSKSLKDKYDRKLIDMEIQLAGGYIGGVAAQNEEIGGSQARCLFFVLLAIFISCLVTYRSFAASCLLVTYLALSAFLTFGFMKLLHIGLNVDTLPVISIGAGIGVDYGIYILSRIMNEYRNCGKYLNKALMRSILTTGTAVVYTATTMVVSVLIWYFFSSLRFNAEMGLLLAFLLFANMCGSIILIPAIIAKLKPKFIEKEGIFLEH
jgi:hypothetical protein